jgi:ADP-heptose:LPS heptosyltransferase
MPAETLAPLLALREFEFHCLQKEIIESDREWLDAARPSIHLYLQHLADFADTAALIAEMDVVVTIDTAIVHLAGGMGKPMSVMLPFAPDWRWMLQRGDSPWYPTARLFRQPARGAWQPVIQAVIAGLRSG